MRALEFALGAVPVPVLRRLDVRQRGVSFGRIAVEHHRRRGARGRLGPHLRRLTHAVVREQAVASASPLCASAYCASSTIDFSKKSSALCSPSSVRWFR